MQDLAAAAVNDFLDDIAARRPTPGGGAVAATAGALACAMARMVSAYSGRPDSPAAERPAWERTAVGLRRADELLRALITEDAKAYGQLTAAAKAARADASTEPVHQQAVLGAIAAPLQVAALAAEALVLMDQLKESANRYLLSDLGVAAVLAAAAAQAAGYSVQVNLPSLKDRRQAERLMKDLIDILHHTAERRQKIEAYVRDFLKQSANAG